MGMVNVCLVLLMLVVLHDYFCPTTTPTPTPPTPTHTQGWVCWSVDFVTWLCMTNRKDVWGLIQSKDVILPLWKFHNITPHFDCLTSTSDFLYWCYDCLALISTMGFPILARWHLCIESGPCFLWYLLICNSWPSWVPSDCQLRWSGLVISAWRTEAICSWAGERTWLLLR